MKTTREILSAHYREISRPRTMILVAILTAIMLFMGLWFMWEMRDL